jgi:RNA polymerase sigma-70 factor, ECF subfamily
MSRRADRAWAPGATDLSAAVAAARDGDDESFRLVYRAVQPLLLRYLRALVGHDAEDVASETWLQIVRDLHSFRGDYGGFRGWAATIARHRALDHVRYVRRRPSIAVPVEEFRELADEADTAGLTVEAVATRAAIELIATLPPDQAEAVLLRVVMGLDVATTAQVLGKRAGAVRTAAYRGLRRLAEHFQPPEHTPAVGGTEPGTTAVTSAGKLTLKDMR